MKVGIFGGSFNPIHCGHLIVARAVAERLDFDRVIFLPSSRPPNKRRANLRKHGIDFADAETIFAGHTVTAEDTREAYPEQRFVFARAAA